MVQRETPGETPGGSESAGTRPRRDLTLAPCNHRGGSVGSPPPVDPNVGRSGEPGIEDVDAADAVGTQQRVLERRVVVEPQALPEPVDRINDHHSTGRVLYVLFLDGEVVLCARFTPADALKCILPVWRGEEKKKEKPKKKRGRDFQTTQEKRVYANLAYKRGKVVQLRWVFSLALTEPFP